MEEPAQTVRAITAQTVRRGTVRAITVQIVRRAAVRMEGQTARAITGIIMARTVQTISVETVRRGTVRMEERAAIITAGAATVRREDVPITVAARAEETRWDVR